MYPPLLAHFLYDNIPRSELGACSLVLVTCIPAFILVLTGNNEAERDRRVEALSVRIRDLTKQIPTIETVHGIMVGVGAKTGSQFRSVMHVVDVAFVDQHETARNVINSLTAWYWHVRKCPFLPGDYAILQRLRDNLYRDLQPFAGMGCSVGTPKVHCCLKIANTMRRYGAARHVSTDAYERAHKAHKAVYQRSVHYNHCCMPREVDAMCHLVCSLASRFWNFEGLKRVFDNPFRIFAMYFTAHCLFHSLHLAAAGRTITMLVPTLHATSSGSARFICYSV